MFITNVKNLKKVGRYFLYENDNDNISLKLGRWRGVFFTFTIPNDLSRKTKVSENKEENIYAVRYFLVKNYVYPFFKKSNSSRVKLDLQHANVWLTIDPKNYNFVLNIIFKFKRQRLFSNSFDVTFKAFDNTYYYRPNDILQFGETKEADILGESPSDFKTEKITLNNIEMHLDLLKEKIKHLPNLPFDL